MSYHEHESAAALVLAAVGTASRDDADARLGAANLPFRATIDWGVYGPRGCPGEPEIRGIRVELPAPHGGSDYVYVNRAVQPPPLRVRGGVPVGLWIDYPQCLRARRRPLTSTEVAELASFGVALEEVA